MRDYRELLEKTGEEPQIIKTVEECAELQQALCKYLTLSCNCYENIIEEMADVEIMLEQLKEIFGNTKEVEAAKEFKIKRTEERFGVHISEIC